MSWVTCVRRVADTLRQGSGETFDGCIVSLHDIGPSRGVGKVNEANFEVHSIARVGHRA